MAANLTQLARETIMLAAPDFALPRSDGCMLPLRWRNELRFHERDRISSHPLNFHIAFLGCSSFKMALRGLAATGLTLLSIVSGQITPQVLSEDSELSKFAEFIDSFPPV